MNRRFAFIYLGLIANVLAFFYKPLFNENYIFPWDFRYVQLPLISFLAEELRRGKLPLWDPFTYCGNPIFANIQAAFFHPLILGAAFLSAHTSLDSLPMMLEWVVVFHIVIAGIFTFHLLRYIGAGLPSAFAGAVIFETGGFFASQAEHIGAIMSAAWMPLAWLSILHMRRSPTWGWFAMLSVSVGMSVLGGLPQVTVAVVVSIGVLSILVILHKLSHPSLFAVALAGILLGLALAAIQLLPTWQLTDRSVAKYRSEWLGTGGGLYWQSFVSLVLPNHYHLFDLAKFNGPGDITFLYLYGSIGGLTLAVYCIAVRRDRFVSILSAMLLFGAFWMLGDKTPLWRVAYPLLPISVRIGIHPEFAYCVFTLSFAVLAGLGLDRVQVQDLTRWGVGFAIGIDLFLVGSGRPMNCTSVLQEPGLTRQAFDGNPEVLQITRDAVNRDFPPGRIDTMDASINWAECATMTRVPAANGSSPLALENIVRLQMLALRHPGVRWGWYYQVENPNSPVLDIMNVKYLLVSPRAAIELKANPRYRHFANSPGYELFENLSVLPRYFLVSRVDIADDDAIEHHIKSGGVDLRRAAFSDRPVPSLATQDPVAHGTVRILQFEPDSLELEVSTDQTNFLVLSEAYYPGWRASIDGQPTDVYRTDMAFRGLLVPAGKHRILMEFRPVIFSVSAGLSAVFLGLTIGAVLFGKRDTFSDTQNPADGTPSGVRTNPAACDI